MRTMVLVAVLVAACGGGEVAFDAADGDAMAHSRGVACFYLAACPGFFEGELADRYAACVEAVARCSDSDVLELASCYENPVGCEADPYCSDCQVAAYCTDPESPCIR